MNHALRRALTAVVLSLSAMSWSLKAQPAGGSSSKHCDRVPVSFETKTIDGINADSTIDVLRRRLGTRRITQVVESLEGEPNPAWDIDFCGHAARRHWNGISWKDPAFRTRDGLGVGSSLRAFDDRYEPGVPYESEDIGVRYLIPRTNRGFSLKADNKCFGNDGGRVTVDRGCRVTGIFLELRPIRSTGLKQQ